MDSVIIRFPRTRDETEKAWRIFSSTSKAGKLLHRFGFPIASVIIFVFFFRSSQPFTGNEFSGNGEPYPVISFFFYIWINLCIPAFFSLLLGWFLVKVTKLVRGNDIAKKVKSAIPESFGEITITLEQGGLNIRAPLFNVQYDWKLLESVLVTQEYLFICSGKGIRQSLVAWIPINALGAQSTNIILSIENWLVKSKQT